jgi:iron complex outermembrane receptor protein
VNLFNSDPPFANLPPSANQSGGFDVQNSNPLGRLITAGVTLQF